MPLGTVLSLLQDNRIFGLASPLNFSLTFRNITIFSKNIHQSLEVMKGMCPRDQVNASCILLEFSFPTGWILFTTW